MKSFYRYTLLILLPVLLSSCFSKVTIDSLPKLTRLNAGNYKVGGSCSYGNRIWVYYKTKEAKNKRMLDFFNCNSDDRWSGHVNLSKVNRNTTKEVTIIAESSSPFSPSSSTAEAIAEVVSDSKKVFIDDSAIAKHIDYSNIHQLAISGGCIDEGDELNIFVENEMIERAFCHEGHWLATLDLRDIIQQNYVYSQEKSHDKKQVKITVFHQDSDGVVTEDSHQLLYHTDTILKENQDDN